MAETTDWKIITPIVGAQAINEVSTVQRHELGLEVQARDVGANLCGVATFKYVKGVTDGARGAWAGINMDDGSTTLAVANGIYGLVGIMMSDLDAATDYGWVGIDGKIAGLAGAAFADNGNVYLTATAGTVDDADVAGDLVSNAKGAAALDTPETGFAHFEIHRPHTDDGIDD